MSEDPASELNFQSFYSTAHISFQVEFFWVVMPHRAPFNTHKSFALWQ